MAKKAELVFIPMPGMGHLVPIVQLAKLLVHLNSSLSITILTIKTPYDPKFCAYIDSLSADRTSTNTSRIKFINLPQPDPDVDEFKFLSSLAQTQGSLVKEAVTNIVELSNSVPGSPRLAGFVLDMFLTPFVGLAKEFGVPSYALFSSGAGALGFAFYIQALHDEQNDEFLKFKDSETEFTIPSYINPVSTNFFPSMMSRPELVNFFILNMARGLREVKGILINTFSELESHAVDSLSNGKHQIPPIYPVGPILDLADPSGTHQNYDTILQWLDEQPHSSVVFLCFGSMGSFSLEQVTEIAHALEQSGHRFLWSLRRSGEQVEGMKGSPTDYEDVADVLPEGFLDRMAGIGKVIGWAPQKAILSHPATGGFVSHCGWNSTLESIWFGVPMAVWPLYAEQNLNAFMLVKESGLAIDLKMDYKNHDDEVKIVEADKIERGIKCLMEQDNNVRKRMKEMRDKIRKTLLDGGSSHSTLCCFMDDVMHHLS